MTNAAALQQVAWDILKQQRGEAVTFAFGSASVSLTGVFTRPNQGQVDTSEAVVIESRSWDVLIDPSWPDDAPEEFTDLEPQRGAIITRADGSQYVVQPSEADQVEWRWSGPNHTWRRVHVEER